MANARAGGHHAEVVKGFLPPFQEHIAFHIAFVFAVNVGLKRAGRAEFVDHHGMVDDKINWHQRVDLGGRPFQPQNSIAHRGQIDHGGHAGEVLHQDPRRAVGDFTGVLPAQFGPFAKGANVI